MDAADAALADDSGIFIVVAVLAFNFMGDALRDASILLL